MNREVRYMLERMFEIIKQRFPDSLSAWDHLMEFLILDFRPICFIGLKDNIEWLFNDSKLIDELMDVYDSVLLKSDYYDHLGEMYFEKFNSSQPQPKQDRHLLSELDTQNVLNNTIDKIDKKKAVFDPIVGTGKRLMAVHKIAPQAILFGVDSDLRLIRIALTNCAIHDIQSYLLHADFLKHNTNIATEDGKHNWRYSNKWQSSINKLKVIDESIKSGKFLQ